MTPEGRSSSLPPDVADLPGALLRKVAHDITGPAGVAAGALKELENALGGDAAAHATMLGLAFRSLQRLERLAKRLRLTAMLHDGVLELDSEPILVGEIVEKAVAGAARLDGRKNVTLEGPEVPPGVRVRADKDHLAFALSELMSNSLRFARQKVRVGAVREGDILALVFEDDGPGYPAGFAEALQGGGRAIPRESGMALPIVTSLATRFGGRLVLGPSTLVTAKDERPGAMARLELPVFA